MKLINEKNYVKSFIVGHSSDDDAETIGIMINSGADHFERKPLKPNNLKNLILKIEERNML